MNGIIRKQKKMNIKNSGNLILREKHVINNLKFLKDFKESK